LLPPTMLSESNSKYHPPRVIAMCEVPERRIITKALPYDLDEPGPEKDIAKGLMRLSQQALSKYVLAEPDIY